MRVLWWPVRLVPCSYLDKSQCWLSARVTYIVWDRWQMILKCVKFCDSVKRILTILNFPKKVEYNNTNKMVTCLITIEITPSTLYIYPNIEFFQKQKRFVLTIRVYETGISYRNTTRLCTSKSSNKVSVLTCLWVGLHTILI